MFGFPLLTSEQAANRGAKHKQTNTNKRRQSERVLVRNRRAMVYPLNIRRYGRPSAPIRGWFGRMSNKRAVKPDATVSSEE